MATAVEARAVIFGFLPFLALTPPLVVPHARRQPESDIRREFRAVWVATVDNIDWPSKRGIPTEKAMAEMRVILDTAKRLNFNAVILQVRPHADALYNSAIEPWSEYLTGAQGKAPQPYWDPLAYAVQEAHRRGLELHCWFNPYRAWHPAAKGKPAVNYFGLTNPDSVKQYGKYQWMDPADPKVQQRTMAVMLDVAHRYDIDGVHIDDYFYPYKEGDQDFPDDRTWKAYKAAGGTKTREEWRRHNVDDFIEHFYTALKKEKKWVKFGISPFGIYRPGIPAGIKAGVDQYADLYADCKKWLNNGWCDYFTPQLYWPIGQTAQSYPVLLKWWMSQNTQSRHMWPGNYTGRTDPGNGNWKAQEVVDQIISTRTNGAGGNVHFSMKCFLKDWNGIDEALETSVYALPALVPASPWLDNVPPPAPKLLRKTHMNGYLDVFWQSTGEPIRFYLVSGMQGGQWSTWSISSEAGVRIGIDKANPPVERIAIRAIDRGGNVGPALELVPD